LLLTYAICAIPIIRLVIDVIVLDIYGYSSGTRNFEATILTRISGYGLSRDSYNNFRVLTATLAVLDGCLHYYTLAILWYSCFTVYVCGLVIYQLSSELMDYLRMVKPSFGKVSSFCMYF
jgi:hypothetical protein